MVPFRAKGTALSEYALIGSLVAVVAIGSLTLLGKQLNTQFASMITLTPQPNLTGATANASLPSAPGVGQVLQSSGTSSSQSGSLLNPSLMPANLPTLIQTVGANGATEMMSSDMADTARRLLSEGQISQDQADALLALSNQGHRMAAIEKLVEQTIASSSTVKDYMHKTVQFEGKNYNIVDLANELGTHTAYSPNDFQSQLGISPSDANPEMASFLKLYQQVQASGVLSNPAAAAEVQQMGTQISYLSNIVMHSNNAGLSATSPATSLKKDMLENIKDGAANITAQVQSQGIAGVTNQDSIKICKAGNSKHCQ